MKKMKLLSVFILSFLVSILLHAKTIYLTDLEGRFEPVQNNINNRNLSLDGNGQLDFTSPDTKLVYGGDLMDRGPHSIKLLKMFNALKNKYPDRVTFLLGNRDLNKLSFSLDREEKMAKLQDPKYRDFLQKVYISLDVNTQQNQTLESINTVENQIQFWAESYGLTKTIEFHQQEMRELSKSEVTYSEASLDFADMITNPNREYIKYIKNGQLVHSEGSVVYVHGGLPSQNGFLPDSATIHEDFNSWSADLNKWGKIQINEFVKGLVEGQLNSKGKKLSIYGDALYDSVIKKTWNHDNSVVYGPRYKENGNFRLPQESTLTWLKANNKDMVILGHSPAGNVPTPLRSKDILYVMADTSYSPNGINNSIIIDGSMISVQGTLENGSLIKYTTSAKDNSSAIGLKFNDEIVIGKNSSGENILFKYVGRDKIERVVKNSDLPFSELKAPIYTENSEFNSQKVNLLTALAERGQKAVEVNVFEQDFLNGRKPVLFSGSSSYADETQQKIVTDIITKSLNTLDPAKVVIITGGTDKGPEKLVHEIAKNLGFYTHGLLVSAAVPEEVSKTIDSFSWVGHSWDVQPKIGMDLIKNNNGFGIIIGGGGLLQKGLEYGLSIKAKFYVASNVKHGNGAVSASMNFSQLLKDKSFSNGSSLERILKKSDYSVSQKVIQEVTAEQAINIMKNRGKEVVTFIGFSGAEYENQNALETVLKNELSKLNPKKVLINIGGTPDGIGKLYETAKEMGFETSGIVSSKAKKEYISAFCDKTYMIKDPTWGGFVGTTKVLSQTSKAMVHSSHKVIAIGGGAVGRDEFLSAKSLGIPAVYFPAEMNKAKALAKAQKAGKEAPTEFRGDLELALNKLGLLNNYEASKVSTSAISANKSKIIMCNQLF